MKNLRKIIVVVVVALSAACFASVRVFNGLAGKNRELVQQELQRFLGKDVRFESLDVSIFWPPGFVAREFRVADDPRFAATPALRARELILGVDLWQLLFGRVVVNSLNFQEPELQIIADETGLLNLSVLSNRKKDLAPLPKLRPAPAERKQSAVAFSIEQVRVDDGRVVYVDRSVKEPAELQVRDIDLKLTGLDPTKPTRLRAAAALIEGLGQDARIEGILQAAGPEQNWSQRGMDLSIRFDSLHVPVVARAIAALRDKMPRELDVTGPMSLQARASGTLGRPRINDITLKIPLFGSSEYNAVITGNVEFTERRAWNDAKLEGNLKIEPLALSRLRLLPVIRENLPAALVTDGSVGIFSRFEGTWNDLRVGALVRADKADFRFHDWLRKPVNHPAELRARISRLNQRIVIHDSELSFGAAKTIFSGAVHDTSAPRLHFTLKGENSPVAAWSPLINGALVGKAGKAGWHLALEKILAPAQSEWNVEGQLTIADGEFQSSAAGNKLQDFDAQITFLGQQARIDRAAFRVGTSTVSLTGSMPKLAGLTVYYQLNSPELKLADVPGLAITQPLRLKAMNAKGELQPQNGSLALSGSIWSPEANLGDFGVNDFRSDFAWSAGGIRFKNLSFGIFQGTLRSDGYWTFAANNSRLQINSEVNAIEVRPLVATLLPLLKDRLDGQMSGHAEFDAPLISGASLQDTLKGSGEALVHRVVIKDVNLVAQLLLRGSGTDVSATAKSRLPAGLAGLALPNDTRFDSLRTSFTVEEKRIRTDDLIISTADYTITGAGWIGLDRSTKWNGLLVLSPRLTQEVQRDNRWLRYLLDRRGRLSISFRVEGTIPDVRIRLENRALAQALRGGSPQRGRGDPNIDDSQRPREEKSWLPDALGRFLNR